MKELKTFENKQINFIIAGVIAFSTIIRIYFFNLVKNQAHWWDSLAYGSLAKNLIYHKWDGIPFIVHESTIRPPFLPLIWSLLLRIGSSDYTIIFLTNIIPSIISIFLIYLIGKEMYGNKIGIIASILASVSWIHLFYSARALTDIPSMCLVLASIYFFVKSHNSLKLKHWALSIFFLSIAVLFRYSHAVIALAYLTFLISTHKIELFKNKQFWIGGLVGAIPLIIFILINIANFGSVLPATSEYSSSISQKADFAWYTINFINHILRFPLIILFYLGLLLILVNLTLSYGFISKNKESKMNLFNIILLVFTLFFYVFIIKASEDRYLLGLSSVLFILPAIAMSFFYKSFSKYGKEITYIFLISIIVWSAYSQLSFAKDLMLNKKESYRQMKDAYEWVKLNTPQDSIITGDWAEPYAIYYADRRVQVLPQDLNFSNFNLEADYIILTAVHQPNEKVVNYVNKLAEDKLVVPVKAFFFDAEEKQPAVIIYKRV